MTTATNGYASIGHLCGQLQRSIQAIRKAATELGIEPALRLNNVPHFSDAQVEQLFAHFREKGDR